MLTTKSPLVLGKEASAVTDETAGKAIKAGGMVVQTLE